MMTAANVLEVSNWITELKLLMLLMQEYETGTAVNVVLMSPKQTRVIVPWAVVRTTVSDRAKFLITACTDAGVDIESLQAEISKHLSPTAQSGG